MVVNSNFDANKITLFPYSSQHLNKSTMPQPAVQGLQSDTAELSNKKSKASNGILAGLTTLGAGIGAIIGNIYNKSGISKASKEFAESMSEYSIKQNATEAAASEFGKKIADSLEDFWIKGNASEETVKFLKEMEMDSEHSLVHGGKKLAEEYIKKLRTTNIKSYYDIDKIFQFNQSKVSCALSIDHDYPLLIESYLKGNKEALGKIKSIGEHIKEHGHPEFDIEKIIQKGLESMPEELKAFQENGRVNYPNTIAKYIRKDIPCINYKYNEVVFFENLKETKKTEITNNLLSKAKKLKIKHIAIGAGIAAGVGLIAGLIIKHVKNKKAEKTNGNESVS